MSGTSQPNFNPPQLPLVLFVCTGNTCRSPLATVAWTTLAEELRQKAQVASAGLAASVGEPASPHTQTVATGWGQSLDTHRAQRLTPDLARAASLIVTMTEAQAKTVRARYNLSLSQVRSLGSYALSEGDDVVAAAGRQLGVDFESPQGLDADIADPFGGSLEAYEACGAQIRRAVEALARELPMENPAATTTPPDEPPDADPTS